MVTLEQARMGNSPVLTSLMLGMSNGTMVAEKIFPRLNSTMTAMMLMALGNAANRRYDGLKRAPGGPFKQVEITFEGKKYTISQSAVDVPIPFEVIKEINAAMQINQGQKMEIDRIGVSTGYQILTLDYEREASELASNASNYAVGNTEALTGAAKWSNENSTPITDIDDAMEVVRGKAGIRPNCILLSAKSYYKIRRHKQVLAQLSSVDRGAASLDQLKSILDIPNIFVGDATMDGQDLWGANTILYYTPNSLMTTTPFANVSLTEPAFGFTGTTDNGISVSPPFVKTDNETMVYRCKFHRTPHITTNGAGFLFQTTV
mgnify:FL=1